MPLSLNNLAFNVSESIDLFGSLQIYDVTDLSGIANLSGKTLTNASLYCKRDISCGGDVYMNANSVSLGTQITGIDISLNSLNTLIISNQQTDVSQNLQRIQDISSVISTIAYGGSGQQLYLNNNTSGSLASTKQLGLNPDFGSISTITSIGNVSNSLVQSFITDSNIPFLTMLPVGVWNMNIFALSNSATFTGSSFYYIVSKVDASNNITQIVTTASTPTPIISQSILLYTSVIAIPQTTLLTTDRIMIRLYSNSTVVSRTMTFSFDDTSTASHMDTNLQGTLIFNTSNTWTGTNNFQTIVSPTINAIDVSLNFLTTEDQQRITDISTNVTNITTINNAYLPKSNGLISGYAQYSNGGSTFPTFGNGGIFGAIEANFVAGNASLDFINNGFRNASIGGFSAFTWNRLDTSASYTGLMQLRNDGVLNVLSSITSPTITSLHSDISSVITTVNSNQVTDVSQNLLRIIDVSNVILTVNSNQVTDVSQNLLRISDISNVITTVTNNKITDVSQNLQRISDISNVIITVTNNQIIDVSQNLQRITDISNVISTTSILGLSNSFTGTTNSFTGSVTVGVQANNPSTYLESRGWLYVNQTGAGSSCIPIPPAPRNQIICGAQGGNFNAQHENNFWSMSNDVTTNRGWSFMNTDSSGTLVSECFSIYKNGHLWTAGDISCGIINSNTIISPSITTLTNANTQRIVDISLAETNITTINSTLTTLAPINNPVFTNNISLNGSGATNVLLNSDALVNFVNDKANPTTCSLRASVQASSGAMYFNSNAVSAFHFRNASYVDQLTIDQSGNMIANGTLTSPTITTINTNNTNRIADISNCVHNIMTDNITANSQTITPTIIGYLAGVTSSIQTQLNNAAAIFGNYNTWTNTNVFNGDVHCLGVISADVGYIICNGPYQQTMYTVALLNSSFPASGWGGARMMVSDSNAFYTGISIGNAVVGGGSYIVPVFSNSTSWVIG